ncbi:MAG: ABC transporter ATP-binding protein [Hydrogenophilales bacterium 28-61-23]|nr:MAG: ABC transporter ATP-binding protein [Hydrogenophilales bacterium 28-61-23]
MSNLALEAINVSKRFGELRALDRVSLKLAKGGIHALLGENGAGKSTLVKCIVGFYTPDEGEVLLGERQQTIANPRDAHDLGIGMVYQHFTLIPNMTVLENLVLARPHLPAVIDWKKERRAIGERMARMPFQLPLDASVNHLAAGEKQKLEIVKQLLLDVKVLILDEPTSVLTPDEADEVLGRIRDMTRESGLSVLIITHKFREVMTYADDVTVLRRGKHAGSARVSDVDVKGLAEMMVGSEFSQTALAREAVAEQPVKLDIAGLSVEDDSGMSAIHALSLKVKAGEIVGIAGVSGNGQRELVEVLAGQRPSAGGEIRVMGEVYAGRRRDLLRHGFHCLPEEPLRNASVARMSVAENLAFRRFDQAPFSVGGFLRRGAMAVAAARAIVDFKVRPPTPDTPIGDLSGGNVQRAILARELGERQGRPMNVLVVANPCFGLDFTAVAEIHGRIMAARNAGAAVLLVSEDLDEILELSDRIHVMSAGRLVYETTPQAAEPIVIGRHMAGHGGENHVH